MSNPVTNTTRALRKLTLANLGQPVENDEELQGLAAATPADFLPEGVGAEQLGAPAPVGGRTVRDPAKLNKWTQIAQQRAAEKGLPAPDSQALMQTLSTGFQTKRVALPTLDSLDRSLTNQTAARTMLRSEKLEDEKINREQLEKVGSNLVSINAAMLGVDVDQSQSVGADGRPLADEAAVRYRMAKRSDLRTAFKAQFGTDPSEAVLNTLLSGGTYDNLLMRNLDAERVEQTQSQIDLAYGRDAFDRVVAKADATGIWETTNEDGTVDRVDTLNKWRVQLDEAQLTGKLYTGEETLAALAQTWEQDYRDKMTFGYDRIDPVTGHTTHVYGTNELQFVMQKDQQKWEQMQLAGFTYVDPATGEKRWVKGTVEREADAAQRDVDAATIAYQRSEQTRIGYDVIIRDDRGQPKLDDQGNILTVKVDGTQTLEERLRSRALDLQQAGMESEDAYRQAQLEWEKDRYGGYMKVQGFTLNRSDFGQDDVDKLVATGLDKSRMTQFYTANGVFLPDEFNAWVNDQANAGAVDLLATALFNTASANGPTSDLVARFQRTMGRAPSKDEIIQLLKGESIAMMKDGKPVETWIPGSADLDQQRIELQDELTRLGYDEASAEARAREAYETATRVGYFDKDGKRVEGTQPFQERMQTIMNTFNLNELQAQAWYADRARTGYDRLERTADGKWAEVHIQGTQEFASQQDQARFGYWETEANGSLKKDSSGNPIFHQGTEAGNAGYLNSLQVQRDRDRYGYFRVKTDTAGNPVLNNGETVTEWVDGTDLIAQERLARLSSQLTGERADADRAAQYLMSMATSDKSYLGQQYMLARRQAIESAHPTWTDAQIDVQLQNDWREVEGGFGDPLQVEMENLRLKASQEQFDASAQMQYMSAIIGQVGSIGGSLARLILGGDNSSSDILSRLVNGTLTKEYLKSKGVSEGDAVKVMGAVASTAAGLGGGAATTAVEDLDWARTILSRGEAGGASATDISKATGILSQAAPAAVTSVFGSTFSAGFAAATPSLATLGQVAGMATGAAVVLGAAYGTYKLVSGAIDNWQKQKSARKEGRKAFDDWYNNSLTEAERDEVDRKIEATHGVSQQTRDEVAWGMEMIGQDLAAIRAELVPRVKDAKTGAVESESEAINRAKERWMELVYARAGSRQPNADVNTLGDGKRTSVAGCNVAFDIAFAPMVMVNDNTETEFQAVANTIRNLGGRNLIGPVDTDPEVVNGSREARRSLDDITVEEEGWIKQAWHRLPGIFQKAGADTGEDTSRSAMVVGRSAVEPAVDKMYEDLMFFAADMGVVTSDTEALKQVMELTDLAAVTAAEGDSTKVGNIRAKDRDRIMRLATQLIPGRDGASMLGGGATDNASLMAAIGLLRQWRAENTQTLVPGSGSVVG